MPTYIAFLRALNVGAHNRLQMADLRNLCASIGFENVRTYIQSGNVVFERGEADPDALGADLSAALADEFGYDIDVMVRTRAELAAIVADDPFEEPTDDNTKDYVTFLAETPTDDRIEALLDVQSEAEVFAVRGREVYSRLRKDELGDGRFTDAGKRLKVPATRRNWDVVTRVLELASA